MIEDHIRTMQPHSVILQNAILWPQWVLKWLTRADVSSERGGKLPHKQATFQHATYRQLIWAGVNMAPLMAWA